MTSATRRLLIVLLDGARYDVLERLLAKGDLPEIGRHFAEGGALRRAATVCPSTTGPAHLPFVTGCFPGTCDVPGIRWMDRQEYARTPFSLRRFRSYVGAETYLFGGDIRPGTPSLFRIIHDHANVYGPCTFGIRPGRDRTLYYKFFRQIYSFLLKKKHETDEPIERYTLKTIAERPTFLFTSFFGVDAASHMEGPESRLAEEWYRRFDRSIGRIFDALTRAGTREETLVALVTDHGQSATSAHLDLDAMVARRLGRTLAYPFVLSGIVGARAASMVSGNGMAHVYVEGPSGWERPCVEEELPRGALDLVDELLGHPAVDLVVTRLASGKVRVRSGRGEAVLGRTPDGRVSYEPRGSDPFGLPPIPASLTSDEALAATFDSQYPDVLVQILQLFDSRRTGDIIVSARPGWDLRAGHLEHPPHRGSHGALCREHMMVPFGLDRKFPPGPRRTVDLMPSALRWLGYDAPPCDGTPFEIG